MRYGNELTATEIEERIKQMKFKDEWMNKILDDIIKILKEKPGEHNQPSNG